MLIIEFNQLGEHMPDHMVEEFVLYVIEKYNEGRMSKIVISCELIIKTFQAMVVEGKIDHEEIQFLYRGDFIPVSIYGAIKNRPLGFCSTSNTISERIIDGTIKIMHRLKE